MKVFLAVIADLFHFAQNALFGSYLERVEHEALKINEAKLHSGNDTQLALPTFQSVREVLEEKAFVVAAELESGETYFVGVADAAIFSDPVFAFDTRIASLNYGSSVLVTKRGGRWAQVRTHTGDGWVLRDALREHEVDVFPSFHHGSVYDAENSETKKLRLLIKDEFFGEGAHIPLTDAEYVLYRIDKAGRAVYFSADRPRLAGAWQKFLRGKFGIHMGIHPREGSVMEYTDESGSHLAYVEALLPDESIRVSSIGTIHEGEYTESFVTKDMWIELRPIFIQINT